MNNEESKQSKSRKFRLPGMTILFPLVVVVLYGVLFLVTPDRALAALKSSGTVFTNIIVPIVLVFVVMLVLNLFVKPSQIVRFLGSGMNIRGILLSVVAGIISMGPIYVWYPLLKEFKEKGAGDMPVAVFLYNRAVKPFLLPVMIAYFGWVYVVILTVVTIIASIVNGYIVALFTERKPA